MRNRPASMRSSVFFILFVGLLVLCYRKVRDFSRDLQTFRRFFVILHPSHSECPPLVIPRGSRNLSTNVRWDGRPPFFFLVFLQFHLLFDLTICNDFAKHLERERGGKEGTKEGEQEGNHRSTLYRTTRRVASADRARRLGRIDTS